MIKSSYSYYRWYKKKDQTDREAINEIYERKRSFGYKLIFYETDLVWRKLIYCEGVWVTQSDEMSEKE